MDLTTCYLATGYNLIIIISHAEEMKKIAFTFLVTLTSITMFAQNNLDRLGIDSGKIARVAYSFRKLSSAYTGNCIRVRRSSDNTTQDIGFASNGDLDTIALKVFTGTDDGFVSIWYDQSGNGSDLSQVTASGQPRIVRAGVIERENNKPFLRFFGTPNSGSANSLALPAEITSSGFVSVVNKFSAGGDGFILGSNSYYYWHTSPPGNLVDAGNAGASYKNGKFWQNGIFVSPSAAVWNTSLMVNSIMPQTPDSQTNWDNIGRDRTYHHTSNGGGYAELVVFSSSFSSIGRRRIERNQGAYYNISVSYPMIDAQGRNNTNASTFVNRNGAIGVSGVSYSGETISLVPLSIPTTNNISSVTSVSAITGIQISNDGGANIRAGVCWSTSPNPTIANTYSLDAGAKGNYKSTLTGLSANTQYYVRSFVNNDAGIYYGNELNFTTLPPVIPSLSATDTASAVKSVSAISGGTVISDGGAAVTERGICWGTSPNPAITDAHTAVGAGMGSFSGNIMGLSLGITYYARCYATNSVGTAYGDQISFTTRLNVGDTYGGGTIAYIYSPGETGYVAGEVHGLIISNSDLSISARWYNGTFINISGIGSALGTGSVNTTLIVTAQGNSGTYAAKLCRDYRGGGYADWFLPSKDELNKLFLNKTLIGLSYGSRYWSSTQTSDVYAVNENINSGLVTTNFAKSSSCYVRAMRVF